MKYTIPDQIGTSPEFDRHVEAIDTGIESLSECTIKLLEEIGYTHSKISELLNRSADRVNGICEKYLDEKVAADQPELSKTLEAYNDSIKSATQQQKKYTDTGHVRIADLWRIYGDFLQNEAASISKMEVK